MSEFKDWEFSADVQPRAEEVGFALDETLSSVLSLRAEIPDDAFALTISKPLNAQEYMIKSHMLKILPIMNVLVLVISTPACVGTAKN